MGKIASTITSTEDAAGRAIGRDQIWGGEGYTIYVFDDNSMYVESGPTSIAVDADDAASVRSYIAFMGDDADLDADRIHNMMRYAK